MPDLSTRLLAAEDIQPIASAFAAIGWDKPAAQYERYLAEQQRGERVVLVALLEGAFAGYLTIVWASGYPPFRDASIPEIVDFNVLPRARRRGIEPQVTWVATGYLDQLEARAAWSERHRALFA